MLIVAIAWVYVVLMMSIVETSIVAGIMTFLIYCVLPLSVILYLMDSPRRKHRMEIALMDAKKLAQQKIDGAPSDQDFPSCD